MSQNYFQSLIGETVHFINPQGRKNSCKVTVKGALELFKLQKEGYKFMPVVHKSEATCVSCEG